MTLSDRSGHFLEKSIFDQKNDHFVRVTFQFLARAQQTCWPIPGLTTVIGRSFQVLVEPRAVWAGVPKTSLKKSLLGLNVPLAGGPFTCCSGCSTGFRPAREGAKQSPARRIKTVVAKHNLRARRCSLANVVGF